MTTFLLLMFFSVCVFFSIAIQTDNIALIKACMASVVMLVSVAVVMVIVHISIALFLMLS
jgi:hypothetical protein